MHMHIEFDVRAPKGMILLLVATLQGVGFIDLSFAEFVAICFAMNFRNSP